MSDETLMTESAANTTPGAEASTAGDQAATSEASLLDTENATTEADNQQEAPEAKAEVAKKPEAPVVPESYDLKADDGVNVDAALVDQFKATAKDAGLTQEAAQKVFGEMSKLMADKQQQAMKDTSEAWVQASKADKEFGGEKLAENLATAKRAMEFASPEFRDLLEKSHLGNHPEVLRFMYRVGNALAPDKVVTGRPNPDAAKDAAATLYPNQ